MNKSDAVRQLSPLLARGDIPEDARNVLSSTLNELSPLHYDVWIYRAVVVVLGVIVIATVFGGIYIAVIGRGEPTMKLPDAIVAIGSAAVGALAGLLAPSPKPE
jgi:hypothetical protein